MLAGAAGIIRSRPERDRDPAQGSRDELVLVAESGRGGDESVGQHGGGDRLDVVG